jgi:hypothetical protein
MRNNVIQADRQSRKGQGSPPAIEATRHLGKSFLYEEPATPLPVMSSDYLPQPLYQHELQSYSSSTSTVSADHPLRREQPDSFEPIVRRRARVAASTPARAMSLVGLKHIFFRQTITPSISKSRSWGQCSMLFPPILPSLG